MKEYTRFEEQNVLSEKTAESTPSGSSILWLLVGIGIGAGAAMLLTPATGRELRSAIAGGCRRTIDGVTRGAQQLRRRGSNLVSFTRRSS